MILTHNHYSVGHPEDNETIKKTKEKYVDPRVHIWTRLVLVYSIVTHTEYVAVTWIAMADDVEGRALHEEAIHAFLSTCKEKSYFLKASKCEIMWSQITLLGWLVTGKGLCIDPSKVTGISEWPRTLTSVRQVQKTMGVLGYQRPFIPGFAAIARPILWSSQRRAHHSSGWRNDDRHSRHLFKRLQLPQYWHTLI